MAIQPRFVFLHAGRKGLREIFRLLFADEIFKRIFRRILYSLVGHRLPFRAKISEAVVLPSGGIFVRGWCLGPRPVDLITVLFDGRVSVEAQIGQFRGDIWQKFPQYANRYSGFSAKVKLWGREPWGIPYQVEVFSGGKRVYHSSGSIAETPHLVMENSEDDRRLVDLKDRHLGKRAFLLGNGPSVRLEDLERMNGEVIFAANVFYLAYEKLAMRPTYTVCMDLLFLKRGAKIAEKCGTPLFIAERAENSQELRKNHDNVISFRETRVWPSDNPDDYYFSPNPTKVVGFGFGVIYSMMQLAVWMGIKEMFLYGIDHTFQLPKDYVKPGVPVTHSGEPNHFIPNYREEGEKWAPPSPPKIEAAFRAARIYCESRDIKIWNSTRGGKLEVFDRCPIDEVLGRPSGDRIEKKS